MNNKLRSIPDPHCGLCMLGLLLFCLTYPALGMAGEFDTYRYKLEENNNDKVCTHMEDVFSKYFKKPFSTISDEDVYVKDGGVLPPLLPGAKDDLHSFVTMLHSFQPTSPEFDAIKWKVGKLITRTAGELDTQNTPFIAADMGLNNDGQIETFIKFGFMTCYNFYSGGCRPTDSWSVFHKGDIDLLNGPINWDMPIQGQNGHRPLAVMLEDYDCRVIRPFIYDGVTYLSCYSQNWGKNGPDINRSTPDREYTEVLKYQGVEKLPFPDGRTLLKAKTVCRFRMTVAK
ncbi:hypothetical protein SFMTTN_2142 [Sulfuriferula multivorans]|uniref:Uncharacterized protein n=2 Tax=Sulfuriferula multivorans TaxID=1559896 RepID=A0A401JFB5_9PROT|nr:hypothetical protein SFMTTN_2142 [Sulfuriferula multivorans]